LAVFGITVYFPRLTFLKTRSRASARMVRDGSGFPWEDWSHFEEMMMQRILATILAMTMLAAPVGGEDYYRLELRGFSVPTHAGPLVHGGGFVEGRDNMAQQAKNDAPAILAAHDRDFMTAINQSNLPSFGLATPDCGPNCRRTIVAVEPVMPVIPVVPAAPLRSCCGANCRGMVDMRLAGCGINCRRAGPLPACGYYCNCPVHIRLCRARGLPWQTTLCLCGGNCSHH
jgi:hypothetical protein